MNHCVRQNKIESAVYEAIDEISDELDLDIPSYPEVYWVGNRKEIECLPITPKQQGWIKALKKLRSSCTFGKIPKIFIMCSTFLDVAEEAAHYVHFCASGVKYEGRNRSQQKSLRILSEGLAFFETKLLAPQRKNVFNKYPDMFYTRPEETKEILKRIKQNEKPSRAAEYFIYQQGYGLGERIFYDYIQGKTSKKEIKNLLATDFGKRHNPDFTLLDLKLRYWPPQKDSDLSNFFCRN